MTKKEIKIIFSDLYNKKNKIDNLLSTIVDNYYTSRELKENYLLFGIRDREINNLKLVTEQFLSHLQRLVKIKKDLMGHKN